MILYCLLSAFLNAAASLVLGGIVFSKKPRDARTVTFSLVTVFVTAWSVFYFLWQLAGTRESAMFYIQWFSAIAILIPVVYFHFTTKLTGRARPREVLAGYLVSLPFVPLSFTDWIVAGLRPKMMFAHWPEPGRLYPLYLAVFFYFILRSWRLLYLEYRQSSFLRRNQLLYVLAYTVTGFTGGATNFLLWYDIPVPPVGNILVGCYMVGVGYAVVRFRLMDFDMLVARLLAYSTIVAVMAALTPLLYWGVTLLPLPDTGIAALSIISVVVAIIMFWFIPVVRRQIDSFLEQRILGDRLPNRDLLRSLAVRLSSAQGETELFQAVVTDVSDALDVADVAIYTRTEFETDFSRRTSSGHASGFPEHSPLVHTLREAGCSVLLDEAEHGAAGERSGYFSELRRKQGLELAVPIFGDEFFYGFITLGPRNGHVLYTDMDVSLLETIGLQVGLNLRARQLERRSSQTEKLISLGTLAAGLAHELRNPLTSIQTFSALLKERGGDTDLQQEFGAVVQRDVSRIASIIENVAAFAESNKVDMTAVQLSDVLRTVADIVRPELVRSSVELRMPAGTVPTVRGNHSQLLQVFLNLVQNAIQALDGRPGARIALDFETRNGGAPNPLVTVIVSDNGPGIDPALLPRIFEPFITTKATGERRGKHGMGLGLAIVKRIVQHHQGEIDAASKPGAGATFRVHLPLSD